MAIERIVARGYGSFGDIAFLPPRGYSSGAVVAAVVVADVIRNFSLREWRQWHRPKDEEQLERLGITPQSAEIIADVAVRQVKDLRLDEQQRLDELRGEMRLRGLEMESLHLQVLNAERERLINAEIASKLRLIQDNNDTVLLMLMVVAAS